jgi:hypothetical protein
MITGIRKLEISNGDHRKIGFFKTCDNLPISQLG